MSASEKTLDKIRKLLRLANDEGASEGEIENAMRFARKMMEDHGLTEDAIVLEESTEETTKRIVQVDLHGDGKLGNLSPWDRTLASAIVTLCGCKWYISRRFDKTHAVFYGFEHDVAVAKALFFELRITIRTMARFKFGSGAHLVPVHNDYMKGLANRLYQRAVEMVKPAPSPTNTMAIVRAKDVALTQYSASLRLGKGRASVTRVRHSAAYSAGHADGDKVSLNRNGLGGNSGSAARRLA